MGFFRSNNEIEKENVILKQSLADAICENKLLNEMIKSYKDGTLVSDAKVSNAINSMEMEVANKAKELFKDDTRSFMCKLFDLSPKVETYSIDFEPSNIFSIVFEKINLICGVREDYFGLNNFDLCNTHICKKIQL